MKSFFTVSGFLFSIVLCSQSSPQMLAPGLISSDGVFGFTLSPNRYYLLYFSSGKGGLGEVDLYISYRVSGQWTTPPPEPGQPH